MKGIFYRSVIVLVTVLWLLSDLRASDGSIDVFPNIRLNVAGDEQASYLGISKGAFELYKLKTPLLLVEIFSMYCPHCQAEAPKINQLYDKIAKGVLASHVKLIGIGAGNTDIEVNVFKEKYNIQYPLFSDPEFEIHKQIDEPRTPFIFLVNLRSEKKGEVVYKKLGRPINIEEIVSVIEKHISGGN